MLHCSVSIGARCVVYQVAEWRQPLLYGILRCELQQVFARTKEHVDEDDVTVMMEKWDFFPTVSEWKRWKRKTEKNLCQRQTNKYLHFVFSYLVRTECNRWASTCTDSILFRWHWKEKVHPCTEWMAQQRCGRQLNGLFIVLVNIDWLTYQIVCSW